MYPDLCLSCYVQYHTDLYVVNRNNQAVRNITHKPFTFFFDAFPFVHLHQNDFFIFKNII